MITPIAPASRAFWSLFVNPHVPRWISEMAPRVLLGKSVISQPLVEPPVLGTLMSVVGTTLAETDFVGECSKAMKSTDGELSCAALPAMYVLLVGAVRSIIGAAASCQIAC